MAGHMQEESETATVADDGVWSVHQRPRSLRYRDQTFVGWINSTADVGISSYDHVDGVTTSTTLDSVSITDDHSSPALYIRDDEKIVLYWTDRNQNHDTLFWVVSIDPLDISSWGDTNSFTSDHAGGARHVDYPQPVDWNGNLRLHYRVGAHHEESGWYYRDSTNGGRNFGEEKKYVEIDEWTYAHPYRANSKLHFVVGDYRMDNPGIYHWYLKDGNYYRSDGTRIQSTEVPLTDTASMTTVYDGTTSENNPPKLYDLICCNDGHPHVAFSEHVETGTGGGDGDYRARWAKWDGTEWILGTEVTKMGGAIAERHFYEGGLSLDAQDPTTVYVSVEGENRNYRIQEWTTDDDGTKWRLENNLSDSGATVTDPTKRGRPISPRNHDSSELSTLWWEGQYKHFENYQTQVQHGL